MATRVSGIDVSHYQQVVDWAKVKAAGIAFAFAKATDGLNSDPTFARNWAGIGNAGLLRGAYHFFRPLKDAAAQAKHFMDVVSLAVGDLPPVLDVETADGASNDAMQSGVKTWLDTVAAQTGVTPMIYAAPGFWNQHLNDQFGSHPLWIAEYGVPSPKLPHGWTNWNFWQYSQSGQVDGVSGNVDLDYFQGSMDDLTAFSGSASTPAAPAPAATAASRASQTYAVQSGDTLGAIAKKFNVSVDALASANGIQNPNSIQVGQVLQVPQNN
jgi:lysozyme